MVKRVLVARERATDLYFVVHLDDARVLADGRPDPAWVIERAWSKTPPAGRTLAQYRADVVRELRALADEAIAGRGEDGLVIPGVTEGAAL